MTNLSTGELSFFRESLRNNCRLDGRELCDIRPFIIEHNAMLFPNALYGLTLNVPDSRNSIMIGINANIVLTKDTFLIDDYITLSVVPSNQRVIKESENTSVKTVVSEIEDLLRKFILSRIDLTALSLHQNKLHWQIECTLFVVGQLQLNDLDYLFKGLKTGLLNCRFPKVNINYNQWTEEFSYEVTGESQLLLLNCKVPTVLIVGEIEGRVVLDMTREELETVDSYYIVAMDAEEGITDIEKLEGNAVTLNRLGSVVSILMNMKQVLVAK